MQNTVVPYLDNLIFRYPILECVREALFEAYQLMVETFSNGGTLFTCGNGGSASDADHIVAELMKDFIIKRRIDDSVLQELRKLERNLEAQHTEPLGFSLGDLTASLGGALPAFSLAGNTAFLTAYGNDVDPAFSFAQQVYAYGKHGDTLFALSTSGNSVNILAASCVAYARGMTVIALTGASGGRLAELANCSIQAPENETYKVQELHLPIYHALCAALEAEFF